MSDLPPNFDPDFLRGRYPDLAGFSDADLADHYASHGKAEGRVAAAAAERGGFLPLVPADADLLEIGPYCNPTFTGPRVKYLDVFDAETLRERALSGGLDASGCPEVVHFTDGLENVPPGSFDVVFSSHAIEHQPDLVRHLQQVGAALRPGGAYYLIVPDGRFCFDHYLPLATENEVLDAWLARRTRHLPRNVLDHIVNKTHNDPVAHWRGDHGHIADPGRERLKHAIAHFEEAEGGYIDVHAWRLTPDIFRSVLDTLKALDLSPFADWSVWDTPCNDFQFTAILRKA